MQLREQSCWFFAPSGGVTPASVREWMGDFSSIRSPAKYAARMGQCFSATLDASQIQAGLAGPLVSMQIQALQACPSNFVPHFSVAAYTVGTCSDCRPATYRSSQMWSAADTASQVYLMPCRCSSSPLFMALSFVNCFTPYSACCRWLRHHIARPCRSDGSGAGGRGAGQARRAAVGLPNSHGWMQGDGRAGSSTDGHAVSRGRCALKVTGSAVFAVI